MTVPKHGTCTQRRCKRPLAVVRRDGEEYPTFHVECPEGHGRRPKPRVDVQEREGDSKA